MIMIDLIFFHLCVFSRITIINIISNQIKYYILYINNLNNHRHIIMKPDSFIKF